MAHSYAQTADLPCLPCDHTASYEVWLIVEVAERPELLARLLNGTLHAFACPACGQSSDTP